MSNEILSLQKHKLAIITSYPDGVWEFLQSYGLTEGKSAIRVNNKLQAIAVNYPNGAISRDLSFRLGILQAVGIVKQYNLIEV